MVRRTILSKKFHSTIISSFLNDMEYKIRLLYSNIVHFSLIHPYITLLNFDIKKLQHSLSFDFLINSILMKSH